MDMEKVIKALECCLKESDNLYSNPCKDCPYEGKECICIDRMLADALELLKEYKEAKLLIDAISDSVHETANMFRQNDGLKHYDDGSSEP